MKRKHLLFLLSVLTILILSGCKSVEIRDSSWSEDIITEATVPDQINQVHIYSFDDIPEYAGKPYIELNNNSPEFDQESLSAESYESYGELDALGRCTAATACLSVDTMPPDGEKRGEIGSVKPTGWHTIKYDCIESKYLYNRCHMIGWQLSNENDNPKNLITGTRYMNIEMLEYENMVADYIRSTNNHVMYRVTPVFDGNDLLCKGLQMEGYSIEDNGGGICYNVFFYNVQPGIEIDYSSGASSYNGIFLDKASSTVRVTDETSEVTTVSPLPVGDTTYILNRNSKKFHKEDCENGKKTKKTNKEEYTGNRDYLIGIGYEPAKCCNP